MNPMTNIKNVQKLNERELELGIIGKKSWHDDYKDSAWIFIGGLPFDLSEGDVICVFSQYGEIVNLNLIRDHKTGKSKGFAFLCYEDQRSTVLSVDNLNGIKILGRTIRVDHVKDYKVPKDHKDDDEMVRQMREEGCAPRLEDSPTGKPDEEEDTSESKSKRKKKKGEKKKKKKEKKKSTTHQPSSSENDSDSERDSIPKIKKEHPDVKKEKEDKGYLKALLPSSSRQNGRKSRDRDNGYNEAGRRYRGPPSDEEGQYIDSRTKNRDHESYRSEGGREESRQRRERERDIRDRVDGEGREREREREDRRYNEGHQDSRERKDNRDRERERGYEKERHRERSRERGRDEGRGRNSERYRDRSDGRDRFR